MLSSLETEIIFSSPDPSEAEEIRAVLQSRGMNPELSYGPDPVTGVGGHVFGGAGALIYMVAVPPTQAETARDAIPQTAAPTAASPEHEPPPLSVSTLGRMRRVARPVLCGLILLSILPFLMLLLHGLIGRGFMGAVLTGFAGAGAILIVRLVRRRLA